jgi:hypothetical protein
MSDAKFAAARELIAEKQYDAARAVLRSMRGNGDAKAMLKRLPKRRRNFGSIIVLFAVFFLGFAVGSAPSQPSAVSTGAPSRTASRAATTARSAGEGEATRDALMGQIAALTNTARVGSTAPAELTFTPLVTIRSATNTARPTRTRQPTAAFVASPLPGQARPGNCSTAVAMGLSAVEAARWSHLDRDDDGVACYGD